MILNFEIDNKNYQIDSNQALNLAIALNFNQAQPNHFGAPIASKQSLQAGDFVGDTKRGGSCNVDSFTFVPHCNGTHTESIAHIVHQKISIGQNYKHGFVICRLISIKPVNKDKTQDTYLPDLTNTDNVIDLNSLQAQLTTKQLNNIQALVIRTLPNTDDKLHCCYDQNNQPPFFTHQAISWLSASGITHLLVDMPSIDKMYDDGQLSNHHIYWQVEPNSRLINAQSKIERTITEMIYVDNNIDDGMYILNLQIPAFESDAAPSRPILYPLLSLSQNQL